jgi:hypothetical protein
MLVHARRPTERGAGSVLDAIPPIVESWDSVETFDDHTGTPDSSAETSRQRKPSPQTPRDALSNVLSSARSTHFADVQDEATSLPVAPASAARPATVSSHAADVPQSGASRGAHRQSSAPIREASTGLDPERQVSTATLRPSSLGLDSSSARHAEAKRGRDVQVHIGTVEVRLVAPPSPPPPPNRQRDPIPSHTGGPAHAEPLSRGLAWSHGLVQG